MILLLLYFYFDVIFSAWSFIQSLVKGLERVVERMCGKGANVIWHSQKKLRVVKISCMNNYFLPLPLSLNFS